MADKVHVVPHFHWDREWYFTAEESKILLVHNMEEILEMLETREDYPYYVLDGQTSVLEDYFGVAPHNRERVKRLVEAGKLIIGPWYTQTDEMVVGGESIARNLLYGLRDCEEFGPAMMIGYLPDSFGQCARMPQILRGFSIGRSMFWRGTSQRMGTDKTEFLWRDEDGSSVTVQLLPLGYAIGKYLPEEIPALKDRMDKYMPVLERGASTDLLVPNGHDQMPIQKNIYGVMDSMRQLYPEKEFFLSNYDNLFDEIEKNQNLDVLEGEFLDGKYMRVHRSIYSSRADLKAANTRIENKITNILEPLAAIGYQLGFSYHHGLIEAIWKELMKNHAHDSMGCCCSDKVHRAIGDRYFLAEDRTDHLITYYKRQITDAMSCETCLDKLTVFNLLPYDRKEVVRAEITTKMKAFYLEKSDGSSVKYQIIDSQIVDAGLIDRQIVHYGNYDPFVKYTVEFSDTIPALGFEAYLIGEVSEGAGEGAEVSEVVGEVGEVSEGVGKAGEVSEGAGETGESLMETAHLENEYLAVDVETDGTLTVTDKERGVRYRQVLMLEDGSDDGDGYDYSPLEQDLILTSLDANHQIRCYQSDNSQRAEITGSMNLPSCLESRKKGVLDAFMDVHTRISLKRHSKVIEVSMTIDNQADDHRVRVLFPNPNPAACSVSDNQFGAICRPVRDGAMDVWKQERWSERPDSIYPFLTYVTTDQRDSLAVVTNSVREYEIIGDAYNVIGVTLFRSVGVLGKEELVRRPGRPSGIKMDTPDSQMRGRQTYEFGITLNGQGLARRAKEYVTPLVSYNKMPYNAMKLNQASFQVPSHFSLLQEKEGKAVLSALKKSEDENCLIMRFYQGSEDQAAIALEKDGNALPAILTGLDEKENLDTCEDGRVMIRKNQVVTLKVM